jgi:Restriction endonuclease
MPTWTAERAKQWRQEHREELAEYAKKYAEAHKEESREYGKRYREVNKERLLAAQRLRRGTAKPSKGTPHGSGRSKAEHARRHYVKHRAKIRMHRRCYAHQRRAKGARVSAEQMASVMASNNGMCAYCLVAPATAVDHINPLHRGGVHAENNLAPACRSCNSSKGTATLLELFMKPRRLVTQRMIAR